MKRFYLYIVAIMMISVSFAVVEIYAGVPSSVPEIQNVTVTGNLTTGDDLSILVNVTDPDNVSARAVYGWGISIPSSPFNRSMVLVDSTFMLNITNPQNSIDPLWYRTAVLSKTGTWNDTIWSKALIRDNDPPEFVSDGSEDVPTTGDGFLLVTNMLDNIGIDTADVSIWIGGVFHGKYSLSGIGNSRSGQLVLPLNASGRLTYVFEFCDANDNNETSPFFSKYMVDNDRPVFLEEFTEGEPTTGDLYEVKMNVIDNWAVNGSWIMYSINDGPVLNISMGNEGSEMFSHMIRIPGIAEGRLNYTCGFMDTSGNVMVLSNRSRYISDDDLPFVVEDRSDEYSTTGDTFRFDILASDNKGISSVKARLWINPDTRTVLVLDKISKGQYGGSFKMYDSLGDAGKYLYYELILYDTSNNLFTSEITNVPIIDNDPPEVVSDLSDIEAFTGEELTLCCLAKDNMDIGRLEVEYTLPGQDPERSIMIYSGQEGSAHRYYLRISIPENMTGEIIYRFECIDIFGNRDLSEKGKIDIIDIISPVVHSIGFPDPISREEVVSLSTGDNFEVVVRTSDNNETTSVKFYYLPAGSVYSAEVELIGGLTFDGKKEWSGNFMIPPYAVGDMEYRAEAYDGSGNSAVTEWGLIEVLDNDPPRIMNITYPGSVGCFDTFTISVRITENTDHPMVGLILPEPFRLKGIPLTGGNNVFELDSLDSPVGVSSILIRVSDGTFEIEQVIEIVLEDDLRPEVYFGTSGGPFTDAGQVTFNGTISDNEGWSIESLVASSGSVSFEVEDLDISLDVLTGSFQPTMPGVWILIITVVDPSGNIAVDTVLFSVMDGIPPIFSLIRPDEIIKDGWIRAEVTDVLDASVCNDPVWTVRGPGERTETFQGAKLELKTWGAGEYHLVVSVTDEEGNANEMELHLTQKEEDPGPGVLFWSILLILIVAIILVGLYLIGKERLKKPDDDTILP
ncbi:MAG: hypothetical protein U9R75_02160 [Candidatus Thermoplasmatota archaeon]|nr:hypothetical protein [Candidatus Thermoplasmatota archaeon]